MAAYIVRRGLASIPVFFFVSIIIFIMVHLAPGDPALIMAGGRQTTPEVLASIRERYNLDKPLPTQYGLWLKGVVQGDFGESFKAKQPVLTMIKARLPITLILDAGALVVGMVVAIPLGILAAVYRNTWVDAVATGIAMIGVASPVFFTGVLAVLIFGYWLGVLPTFGSGGIQHLILPWLVLGFSLVALNARLIRTSMIDVLQSDYIRTAWAKGLPGRAVVLRHAFRSALMPVLTAVAIQIGYLLVGGVLVEYVFGLGGLGSLLVTSILNSDYPVVQAITLLMVTAYVVINIVADLLGAAIDPRVRLS